MLTKSNIQIEDFDTLSAEHEAALAKIRETAENEEKRAEWLAQRRGKFTSSNCHKLMTYEDKIDTLPAGAKTYIEEIVVEILTAGKVEETFRSEEMERGNDMELEAVARFEAETDIICEATGSDQKFIELCSYFGGTPDGLFGSFGLIEVKCPKSKTHLFNIRNLKKPEDLKKQYSNYYWQIQGNFLASGRGAGFFISYDERFENPKHQILILPIVRNETDIEKLKKRLQLAERYKQELLKI